MTIFEIPYTEMLVTKVCNLHCDGCQNYTNYALKGHMDFDTVAEDVRRWATRIRPRMFRLLGGEPFAHPRLADFITLAAEVWPEADRYVVTNGLLAARREDIVEPLKATGTKIELSVHSNDPAYLAKLKPAVGILKRWAGDGITVKICDSRDFIRTYIGVGPHMRPYNHDAVKAWQICTARNCKNIVGGKLWKCPTISMLHEPLAKFGLSDHPDWAPYVGYEPCSPDVDDDTLRAFLTRGPETICSICPASRPTYQKDVFNLNFQRQDERVDVNFPVIDLKAFLDAC